LRILLQDGGSRLGLERRSRGSSLERYYHEDADRILQNLGQNHKNNGSRSKTNKVLAPVVAMFGKASPPQSGIDYMV